MTAAAFTATRYDAWDLRTLREAKAYRDEIGCVIPEFDAKLAEAERQHAAGTGATTEAAALPDSAFRAHRLQGSGYSNYGSTRNAPTDKQVAFLASLHRTLGTEAPTARDRSHASLLIDTAKKAAEKAVEKARRTGAAPAARTERPATEAQINYLRTLVTERETDIDPADAERITAETTSARLASQLIDLYAAKPRRAQAAPAHGIREGRYAFQPAEGPAAFYRVTRTGRIKVQAGPAEHPYRGKLNDALLWIAENPKAAAALYGQLIGECGRCGRELTDETSRAAGLGPICASKSDW